MPDRPRLVVVSAHFPPDFVSGGTLVPDRQARGLAARGWDVSVFAGSLDEARPPLSEWDEAVDGLAVRWIAVAPFIWWDDRRNFDNPAVVERFRSHLASVGPDVVHLHSLQTMGGGMVRAAKDAGAATVVTMHDFWWSCSRQFLVDRTWAPCSLVVDAGACHCEVDRAWLDERNRWLRNELQHADLVLAPSAVAAEVLAANGVPGDRLQVDENGLDEVPAATVPPPHRAGTPIRFRYAGGANRMKGSVVMAEAAHRLAELRPAGWSLEVHAEAVPFHREVPAPLPARAGLVPPFAPEDIDEVLAATDVLVIPSLMRESHSLLTREALLRGVPVITSDCLGPEEVVAHGRNGLVVPTGDAGALAEAMATVVDEPERLRRWSADAVHVVVRRSADQLPALDATLRGLLTTTPANRWTRPRVPAEDRPPVRDGGAPAPSATASGSGPPAIERVLFVVGIDGAPLRYRAHLPAEALALHGVASDIRHYRHPDLPALARAADAVVVYRVPATDQILGLLADVRRERPQVPLLFDVDDLIFDPELVDEIPAMRILPPEEAALWLQGVQRYRTTMEACDAYIGSTEQLVRHAAEVTGLPAYRWDNGVGAILGRRADVALRRPRRPGPLRVGYLSGTTTHDRDWARIEPAVLEVLRERGEVELWLGGHLNPSPAVEELGARLRRLPMQDWRDLPEVLRDLDVNLASLEPLGRFNEAKSAIKWLEAALCATPTIASPTQPFVEVIEHGTNGFLADEPGEWAHALRTLLDDDVTRRAIGARARRDALLGWSPHRQAARYLDILRSAHAAVSAGRTTRPSSFEPVALDEAWHPYPVDPYVEDRDLGPAPPSPASGDRVRGALRARAGDVRRRWRAEGGGAAAAEAARLAARDARRVVIAVRRRLRTGR